VLYVSAWLPESGESRRSLGHRDRDRAVQQARELLALRATDTRLAEAGSPLTLAVLFRRYTTEGRYLPDGSLKTDTYLRHVRLAGDYLERFFGAHQLVAALTPDRIRDYVVWRRGGGATGEEVGTNTIQRDLGMFKAALNWACQKHDGGVPLLTRHPMEKFKVPAEKDPKRPILDAATIRGLLDVAPQVHPFLRSIILLAWRTGRRLSSILALRWEDVDFDAGTIVWRAETDKVRQTWVVPAHREVLLALTAFRVEHPGIGSAFVFPHPQRRRHRAGPVTRHLAAWWLKEAFRRGALTKPDGSLWHMFRRVWATERKDLPLKDVAAAGGWRDTSTLLRYQQPDAATMRSVVEFERQRDVAPVVRKLASNSPTYSLTARR
jgi:integrase